MRDTVYQPTRRDDEDALTRTTVALACQYCRYGYRRITVAAKWMGHGACIYGPDQ
jgi:hypothetical protein